MGFRRIATAGLVFLCNPSVFSQVLFTEDFNGYSGIQNNTQLDTGLEIAHSGSVPGWSSTGGGNDIHAVDLANLGGESNPSDWAVMLHQEDVITRDVGIAANEIGATYELRFALGTGVYAASSQQTQTGDSLLVEVLRADNSVLWSRSFPPGAWSNPDNANFSAEQQGVLSYHGDGSGDVRFRFGSTTPSIGRFGGSIDNLELASVTNAPPPVATNGSVVINEIHYHPLSDVSPAEFIEIYNAGTGSVELAGWALTGGVDYYFPTNALLASGEFLLLAQDSNEFQAVFGFDPFGQWENGNKLSNEGERITLRNVAGVIVDRVDYSVGFPWPTAADGAGPSMELIHPFTDNDLGGAWRSSGAPSPGFLNSVFSTNIPPRIRQVDHTPKQPVSGTNVLITAKVTDPDGVGAVTLSYQLVEPGAYIRNSDAAYNTTWTDLIMSDDGSGGDVLANDEVYAVILPAALQTHRRLIRYRITIADTLGHSVQAPYSDDEQPNFAYYVYDGVPAWSGARQPGVTPVETIPASVMNASLPVYQLIANSTDVVNSQYNNGSDGVRMWGTMVYDGKVYDHIQFYNRGEVSTYVSGKNKWRFKFNRTRDFEARDIYGKRYKTDWRTLNFNANASPWVASHRGMAGLNEAVPHRLHQLAGVPSSHTHPVQFRVVVATDEAPADQYAGDLWGLYLAVEHPDGRFLDERDLADGSTYKIQGGAGNKKNQGPTQPLDNSDWDAFWSASANLNTADWWRMNFDLPVYYGFRAVNRATGNVDMRDGSNYYMFHHTDDRWQVIPWDLDMMYAPVTHWSGVIRADRCLDHAEIQTEFRNRCRGLLDLLFSDLDPHGGQAAQVVEELGRIINPPGVARTLVDADETMWSHHPRTAASHRGPWYELSVFETRLRNDWFRTIPTADLEGFQQSITDYMFDTRAGGGFAVNDLMEDGYGFGFLSQEAADIAIPDRPVISYSGSAGFPANGLSFICSAFSDPQGAGTFAAMEWRIGRISNPGTPDYIAGEPWVYEVESEWESGSIQPFAAEVDIPVSALRPGETYRARVRHWDDSIRASHWSEPVEFVVSAPDVTFYRDHLVISEIMYHPAGTSTAEFVELHNVGSSPVDLTGIRFTKGIDFDFPDGMILATGAYVLVVGDTHVFETVYGPGLSVAGQWESGDRLNDGGENLKLSLGAGTAIYEFEYRNAPPWPSAPNGGGYSLTLACVEPGADHAMASHWRSSVAIGGSPGTSDNLPLDDWLADHGLSPGEALSDLDDDDFVALVEYAVASDPAVPDAVLLPYDTRLSYRRARAADDVKVSAEYSRDLVVWVPCEITTIVAGPAGADTVTVQPPAGALAEATGYYRLRVTD